MMLHPNSNNSLFLPANYTEPIPTSSTILQPGWQQGYQLYRDTVNNAGRFSILYNDTSYVVFVNLTFFAVALPTDSPDTQLLKMQTLLIDITQNKYGYMPVVITPPTPYLQAAPVDPLASICDSTQKCLLIVPITIDPNVFICLPQNNASGPLQPECIAKNRHENRRRFDYLMTVAPPSLQVADDWISVLRVKGMQTIAVIRCPNWNTQADVSVQVAQSFKMPVLFDQSFNQFTPGTIDDWKVVVRQLMDIQPDGVLVWVGYSLTEGMICVNLMMAMKQLNYLPKAIMFAASCTAVAPYVSPLWISENLQTYGYGVAPWDSRLRGAEYRASSIPYSFEPFASTTTEDSPMVFSRLLTNRFLTPARPIVSAQAALAPLLVQKAFESASVPQPTATDLLNGLNTVFQSSHYGHLSLDRYGRFNDRPYPITQFLDSRGSYVLITPIAVGQDPIYPTPGWEERVYQPAFFAQPSEKVLIALTVVCIVYATIVTIWIMYNRHHATIRAASPEFCMLIGCGSVVFMSSVFTWMLHEDDWTCSLKIYLLCTGFTFMMFPLFVKTYRLWRIFDQQQMKSVRLSNRYLTLLVCVCFTVEIIYITIWNGVDLLRASVIVVDPYRPSLNYTICAITSMVWIYIMVAWKGILMLSNAVLAFRVRKIATEFNESIYIAMSIFVTTFMCLIVVPLLFTSSNRLFVLWVRDIAILLIGISVMTIMFIPKMLVIYSKTQDVVSIRTVGSNHPYQQQDHFAVYKSSGIVNIKPPILLSSSGNGDPINAHSPHVIRN